MLKCQHLLVSMPQWINHIIRTFNWHKTMFTYQLFMSIVCQSHQKMLYNFQMLSVILVSIETSLSTILLRHGTTNTLIRDPYYSSQFNNFGTYRICEQRSVRPACKRIDNQRRFCSYTQWRDIEKSLCIIVCFYANKIAEHECKMSLRIGDKYHNLKIWARNWVICSPPGHSPQLQLVYNLTYL